MLVFLVLFSTLPFLLAYFTANNQQSHPFNYQLKLVTSFQLLPFSVKARSFVVAPTPGGQVHVWRLHGDPQTGWVGARLGAADATASAAGLRPGTQPLSAGAWRATCHTDSALLSRPGLRTTPPRPDTLLSSRPISFRLLKEPSPTTPHRVSHRLVPTSSRQTPSLPQRSTPPALQQGSLHSTESGRQVIHCRARPRFLLGTLDSRFLSSCSVFYL